MGISVFHQGSYQNGQLWYSYFDGTNWGPETQVPNVALSYSPSAVVLPGGRIAVFHQGSCQNGQVWYTVFDGTNWGPEAQVPNVALSYSPSAVAFPDGGISVFHQGSRQWGDLWYTYFDPTNNTWQPDKQILTVDRLQSGIFDSPSAVVLPDNRIAVFHQGASISAAGNQSDGRLWYTYFDGTNWGPDTQVPNVGMGSNPSAVVFPDGGISVFHQGTIEVGTGDGQLWYSYWDGNNWAPQAQVPNVGLSISPSAVVF